MDMRRKSTEIQKLFWEKINSSLAYLHDGEVIIPTKPDVHNTLNKDKYVVVNIHNTRKTVIFVNQNNEMVYMSLTPDKYKHIDCKCCFLFKLTQMLYSLEVSPITKLQHLKNFVYEFENGAINEKTMSHIIDTYKTYLTANISDKVLVALQHIKNMFAFGCNFNYISYSHAQVL